jgi:MIT family protein with phospholipase D-like domain
VNAHDRGLLGNGAADSHSFVVAAERVGIQMEFAHIHLSYLTADEQEVVVYCPESRHAVATQSPIRKELDAKPLDQVRHVDIETPMKPFNVKAPAIKKITLITGYDDKTQLADLRDKLGELQQSLPELDVVLDIQFHPNMHDREIRLDHGWVIKIGRGLDFYQRPHSRFEVGAHDLNLRKCLETKVDIFRL